jgi:hypothetical protein
LLSVSRGMTNLENIVLGWPLPKRKEFIDRVKQGDGYSTFRLRFQNKVQDFKTFRIPIEMPKYRLKNGRTQAAQEEYLAQKNGELSEDYFSIDLESEAVHQVQHVILEKMLRIGNADINGVLEQKEQDQPLILDNDGFVINGNRRLVAMRELLHRDKVKYERFKHIEVILLPHCSEKDKDELEADLQIRKDVKADYSWIAEACMLRKRQKDHGYSHKELEQIYGIGDKEIKEKLGMLKLVDDYLVSRGVPKQYNKVENDAEWAFKTLRREREKSLKNKIVEKDIFTTIGFDIIDQRHDMGNRAYQIIVDVSKNLDKVIEGLDDEIEVSTDPDDKDPRLNLFGYKANSLECLAGEVRKPDNREKVLEVVKDVIDSEKAKNKEQVNANSVIKQLKLANTAMTNSITYFNEKTTKKGINEQLDSIENSVQRIRELLKSSAPNSLFR